MKLTREGIPNFPGPNQHTWPLKVTALAGQNEGLPSEIFVFHVDATNGDKFEAIASLHQIYLLGTVPDMASNPAVPYYRAAVVELQMLSQSSADELWQKIQRDVQDLVTNYKAGLTLQVLEEVTIE